MYIDFQLLKKMLFVLAFVCVFLLIVFQPKTFFQAIILIYPAIVLGLFYLKAEKEKDIKKVEKWFHLALGIWLALVCVVVVGMTFF